MVLALSLRKSPYFLVSTGRVLPMKETASPQVPKTPPCGVYSSSSTQHLDQHTGSLKARAHWDAAKTRLTSVAHRSHILVFIIIGVSASKGAA
jgi:hypothetical protein